MGLFDAVQNILGDMSDAAQGSLGEVIGGITDNPTLQDAQDQAASLKDGASELLQ